MCVLLIHELERVIKCFVDTNGQRAHCVDKIKRMVIGEITGLHGIRATVKGLGHDRGRLYRFQRHCCAFDRYSCTRMSEANKVVSAWYRNEFHSRTTRIVHSTFTQKFSLWNENAARHQRMENQPNQSTCLIPYRNELVPPLGTKRIGIERKKKSYKLKILSPPPLPSITFIVPGRTRMIRLILSIKSCRNATRSGQYHVNTVMC